MSADVIPLPTERRRRGARALGVNPRALGLSPRQLAELTPEQRAERIHRAAENIVRIAGAPSEPTPATNRTAARRTPLTRFGRPAAGIPGCTACGGTGWADTDTNTVAPCDCRDGVVL